MTSVGDHGLTCLEGGSYGAVALSMQANAIAIKDALAGIQTDLESYGDRYVSRFVSTSPATAGANSGQSLPDATAANPVIQRGIGVVPVGWYAASSSMSYQATGAVTAGTYRRGLIMINNSGALLPPMFFQSITVETGTGTADSLTVTAWFYSNGIQSTFISVFFGHGNTGSTMTVPAGAVLTVRFLASGRVT